MKSYSPKKSQLVDSRHFTLIELLITIAIIAILAAMLLPALNMARDKSKAIKCLSNMKQTLSALYLYADDNAELLPMPYFDKNKLPGYPKSLAWGAVLQASGHLAKNTIAQCPSVKVTKYKDPTYGWGETFGLIPGSEGHRFVCIKLSTISSKASPSRFSLVIDTIKPASGEQGYQMLPSWQICSESLRQKTFRLWRELLLAVCQREKKRVRNLKIFELNSKGFKSEYSWYGMIGINQIILKFRKALVMAANKEFFLGAA